MSVPHADDPLEVDAFVEALIARDAGERGPEAPDLTPLPRLAERRVAAAAMELGSSLIRFHPSFRFEDRVAARLRAVAHGRSGVSASLSSARSPLAGVPMGGARVIDFPRRPATGSGASQDDRTDRHGRGFLLRGAVASGVSIAGAAVFAWRRGRGDRPARSLAARRRRHGIV